MKVSQNIQMPEREKNLLIYQKQNVKEPLTLRYHFKCINLSENSTKKTFERFDFLYLATAMVSRFTYNSIAKMVI